MRPDHQLIKQVEPMMCWAPYKVSSVNNLQSNLSLFAFSSFSARDGSMQKLRRSMKAAKHMPLDQLGIKVSSPPPPPLPLSHLFLLSCIIVHNPTKVVHSSAAMLPASDAPCLWCSLPAISMLPACDAPCQRCSLPVMLPASDAPCLWCSLPVLLPASDAPCLCFLSSFNDARVFSLRVSLQDRLIPPQGPSLSQIGQHLVKMQKAFSPFRKLEHLMGAVRVIYRSVRQCNHIGKPKKKIDV